MTQRQMTLKDVWVYSHGQRTPASQQCHRCERDQSGSDDDAATTHTREPQYYITKQKFSQESL